MNQVIITDQLQIQLVNDKTELKTISNTFYTSLKSKFFGNIMVSYLNYNYNYKTNALSDKL